MVREYPLMQWLRLMLLAVVLAGGAQQVRAQMTGEFGSDVVILDGALQATLAATGKADPETSRLAMEELYRQWRIFRARNFDAHAGDVRFITDMEAIGNRLFAASQHVDAGAWAAAHDELQAAGTLLQTVRQREAAAAKPAAY